MSEFWEKLYNPIPLYTVENVSAAIEYIDNHETAPHKAVFKSALEWVRSSLMKTAFDGQHPNGRYLKPAYEAAVDMRDTARTVKDSFAAMRWDYVIMAIADYAQVRKRARKE